jgi:glycosyltransferase involved in cell wall biosynthesis
LPELIDHGRTGLLFPSGDAAALADLLHDLLTHPARVEQLRAAGRERVAARHTLGHMAHEYEQLYGELLTTGARSASK